MYQQFFVFNIGEETLFGVPLYALKQDFIQPSALVIFSFFFKLAYFHFNYNAEPPITFFNLFLKYNHKSLGRSPFSNSKFMTHNLLVALVYTGLGYMQNCLYCQIVIPKSRYDILEEQKKSIAFFVLLSINIFIPAKGRIFPNSKTPNLKKNYVYISFRLNSIFILTNHAELDFLEVILLDI